MLAIFKPGSSTAILSHNLHQKPVRLHFIDEMSQMAHCDPPREWGSWDSN